MKKIIVIAIVALLCVAINPLYAQTAEDIVWVGVPLSLSYQFPIQEFPQTNVNSAVAVLSRLDFNVGLQLFFRVSNDVSLGAESGFSAPLADWIYLASAGSGDELLGYPFHIPLRVVLNVATAVANFDVYAGTNFNIIFDRATTLTADLGARIHLGGLFLEVAYIFPFELTLESVRNSAFNYWQNALRIGIGSRIGNP